MPGGRPRSLCVCVCVCAYAYVHVCARTCVLYACLRMRMGEGGGFYSQGWKPNRTRSPRRPSRSPLPPRPGLSALNVVLWPLRARSLSCTQKITHSRGKAGGGCSVAGRPMALLPRLTSSEAGRGPAARPGAPVPPGDPRTQAPGAQPCAGLGGRASDPGAAFPIP